MGTIDSYNWSGARVIKDVLPPLFPGTPQPEVFTSIKATWKVPKVRNARSATWIGLDGGTWGLGQPYHVLQAGTYHELLNGGPTYFAFFGFDDGRSTAYPYSRFKQFPVSPKDTIVITLQYTPGSPTATADFSGSSIAAPHTLPPQPISIQIDSTAITGYTAEWIFERISKDNNSSKPDYKGSYYGLGNHDAVLFSDAEAGTNRGHSVSPDDGDSINLYDVDNWGTLLTTGTALSGEVQISRR
jgi:hypothetical protein